MKWESRGGKDSSPACCHPPRRRRSHFRISWPVPKVFGARAGSVQFGELLEETRGSR